jgi:HPt (histidine-containing phosphotransfer) domain-containing protein
MTRVLGHPLQHSSAIHAEAWNQTTFDDLGRLVGAFKANELAVRFCADLRNRFADAVNRELMRRDAHAVTSTAEVLGFTQLSQAARSLEDACEAREAIDAKLQALLIAKFNAISALEGYPALE